MDPEDDPHTPAPSYDISSPDFFSQILAPGSSLHPTFLLLVDGAFALLLMVLLSLSIFTWNLHFVFLTIIETALWASVKWFVLELQNIPPNENSAGEEKLVNATAQEESKKQS